MRQCEDRALIIVPATSDQMRNTVFLVGSAHPTKTSIPARSQACGNGVSQRDAGRKRDPPGRNDDQAHQAYREKVRPYSEEEKRLWEDLKHGMILGTTEFVKKRPDCIENRRPASGRESRWKGPL